MGIFKKKSEEDEKSMSTKEDIIAAIKALPPDEQAALYEDLLADLEKEEETNKDTAGTEGDSADGSGETETEKQIGKAEQDIAEKGADSQTEKDRIDESVGEQEKIDGNEDGQNAKDRVDESIGEEVAKSESDRVESEDSKEVDAAMGARVSALEEQLTTIADRLEQMLSKFENKDFGANQGGRFENPATEDDEAYMDAYYAKQRRR